MAYTATPHPTDTPIRRRRLELGLSQQTLAQRAAVSISSVIQLESGAQRRISPARDRILAALDAAEAERAGADA
jgi:predicted transcriptional regulator